MNRGGWWRGVSGVIGNIGPTEASVYYLISILDGKVPRLVNLIGMIGDHFLSFSCVSWFRDLIYSMSNLSLFLISRIVCVCVDSFVHYTIKMSIDLPCGWEQITFFSPLKFQQDHIWLRVRQLIMCTIAIKAGKPFLTCPIIPELFLLCLMTAQHPWVWKVSERRQLY